MFDQNFNNSMRSSQVRKTLSGMHTLMTTDEKLNLRSALRKRLSEPPYSAAFLLQEFS
jgi:hypothetical protein